MVRYTLTTEDAVKLMKAHDDLYRIIELNKEFNRKRDIPSKPSSLVTHAYECLHDVLYGDE